jgi:hypothetical protein
MLRRAHDHHRGLRALEPTQGAAAWPDSAGEKFAVTRYGLPRTQAAAPKPRHTGRFGPNDVAEASEPLLAVHHRRERHRIRQRFARIASRPQAIHSRSARHRHQQKTEIPIDHRLRPAGSFLGDFRTPSAPETLHESGPAGFRVHKLKRTFRLSNPSVTVHLSPRSTAWFDSNGYLEVASAAHCAKTGREPHEQWDERCSRYD